MNLKTIAATTLAAALVTACSSHDNIAKDDMAKDAMKKDMMAKPAMGAPFGGPDDVAYAGDLWKALLVANLVGSGAMNAKTYPGQHPHGAVLQTLDAKLAVAGSGANPVIVKRNFGGEGVSVESVSANPGKYLKAVTVMYKRPGYDADNHNWYWAKFLADGSLDKNPKGMKLAGRVAKGASAGCIACHSAAPGGDMVFTSDKFVGM